MQTTTPLHDRSEGSPINGKAQPYIMMYAVLLLHQADPHEEPVEKDSSHPESDLRQLQEDASLVDKADTLGSPHTLLGRTQAVDYAWGGENLIGSEEPLAGLGLGGRRCCRGRVCGRRHHAPGRGAGRRFARRRNRRRRHRRRYGVSAAGRSRESVGRQRRLCRHRRWLIALTGRPVPIDARHRF